MKKNIKILVKDLRNRSARNDKFKNKKLKTLISMCTRRGDVEFKREARTWEEFEVKYKVYPVYKSNRFSDIKK